jgi:hypothetical protein
LFWFSRQHGPRVYISNTTVLREASVAADVTADTMSCGSVIMPFVSIRNRPR